MTVSLGVNQTVQIRFTPQALRHIQENNGSITVWTEEVPVSCCSSTLIPYVSLGRPAEADGLLWVVDGVKVYVKRGTRYKKDLRIRLDIVWRRSRLVAEWV